MFFSLRFRISKRNLLPVAALTVSTVFTAGCANFLQVAPLSNEQVTGGTITGKAHGGNQPISGATVNVIAAGNAGYGSAGSVLATTTTDSNGNFSFGPGSGNTYSCPASNSSSASQMLYITASGGQPTTSVTNTASVLMAALGNCATVISTQPFVNVNEVTTIASMTALQHFFNPATETFGTSSTNITGLTNAFATVNNLITLSTGSANASSTVSGTAASVAGTAVTITPEQAKINTLGNILAGCVNTNGAGSTGCTSLFSNVTSSTVSDTLLAAYYLAVNPGGLVGGASTVSTVYTLAASQAAFQPSLSAAPTDWTIGVTYGSTSTTSGTIFLLNFPTYPAIDANGNVWVVNAVSGTAFGANSLTELSPTGTPLVQALTGTTATTGIIGGHGLVIDPAGNLWVPNFGSSSTSSTIGFENTVLEYAPGTGTITPYTVGFGPFSIAGDGTGNIFVEDINATIASGSATNKVGGGDLWKISGGTSSQVVAGPLTNTAFTTMVVDGNDNLWASNGSTGVVEYLAAPQTVGATAYSSSNVATSTGGLSDAEPMVVGPSNNIWVGNYSTAAGNFTTYSPTASGGGTLSALNAVNSVTTITSPAASPYSGAGIGRVELMTIDGDANVWISNYSASAGWISEIATAGTPAPISPSTGINKPTKSATTTPVVQAALTTGYYLAGAEGIATDASGNVWIGNFGGGATATVPGILTEIVGAAAPTITPFTAALPATVGGTSKVGTRP